MPTSTTRPPGRARETAAAGPSGIPVQSTTRSGPRPSGSGRASATSSSGDIAAAAPSRVAMSRRNGSGSTTATRDVPRARATWRTARPMVPPPSTATRSSGCSRPRRSARTATDSGSASASSSEATSADAGTTKWAGTVSCSARPPGRAMPIEAHRGHSTGVCSRQARHRPHDSNPSMATSCPGSSPSTPSPTSRTRPDTSCPMIIGAWSPVSGCGSVGMMIGPSVYSSRSVPQMPHHSTATRTSSGPGTGASSTSSRRTSRRPCHRSALTVRRLYAAEPANGGRRPSPCGGP